MIAAIRIIANVHVNDTLAGRTDLDSHADQCIVGSNCLVTHNYKQPVSIQGYDPDGSTTDSLRTISAVLAYNLPDTGETLILVVHQAIHLPHLPHNLFSPTRPGKMAMGRHGLLVKRPSCHSPYTLSIGLK